MFVLFANKGNYQHRIQYQGGNRNHIETGQSTNDLGSIGTSAVMTDFISSRSQYFPDRMSSVNEGSRCSGPNRGLLRLELEYIAKSGVDHEYFIRLSGNPRVNGGGWSACAFGEDSLR